MLGNGSEDLNAGTSSKNENLFIGCTKALQQEGKTVFKKKKKKQNEIVQRFTVGLHCRVSEKQIQTSSQGTRLSKLRVTKQSDPGIWVQLP